MRDDNYYRILASWIVALSRRYGEPGYSDNALMAEAVDLSNRTIDRVENSQG